MNKYNSYVHTCQLIYRKAVLRHMPMEIFTVKKLEHQAWCLIKIDVFLQN